MDINIKELTIRIFQVDPLSKSLGENGNQMKHETLRINLRPNLQN